MHNPSVHLEQAKFNEELAMALNALRVPCRDWIVTLCFYSALHYANSKKQLPENHHDAVNSFIPAQFGTSAYTAYKTLYDKSLNARYRPVIAKTYRSSQQISELAIKKLEEFKKEIGI